MLWVSRGWKAKWLRLVWELVEFLSLLLSAIEVTRYPGLAVLISKKSRHLCVEGLKKGSEGNTAAKGADRASVQRQSNGA